MQIAVSNPTVPEAKTLTKEDVWGKFDEKEMKRISNGMIVARSEEICPVFKDKVPYKSVTVVCDSDQVEEVIYWLEYVHGEDSVSKVKQVEGLEAKTAIRSDYQCW